MEHFDDLLSSSSQPFSEANPFADPFTLPRSGSPDPWASFSSPNGFQSSAHDAADTDNHISESYIASSVSHFEVPQQVESESESTANVEPLNTVQPTTPTFSSQEPTVLGGQSNFEDTNLVTSIPKEDNHSPILEAEPFKAIAEPIVDPVPNHAEWRTVHEEPQPTQPSSPPFATPGDAWRSSGPLDDTLTHLIEQPFASLSIGGETAGGRKDGLVTFSAETEGHLPPQPSEVKGNVRA